MKVFLNQCTNISKLPFKPKTPNKETLKAFEESNKGKVKTFTLEEFEKFLNEIAE